MSDYLVDVKLDALLNQIMDLEETALELGVMAQLIHKKLEKQSHSLNALQEQQNYNNNDLLDNANENTHTPKRKR